MTTQLSVQQNDFDAMAKAMGMVNEISNAPDKVELPRLRIWNQPIKGTIEIKGKVKNVDVVEPGNYRIQMPNDTTYYAKKVKIRVYLQRFMYKKYLSDKNTFCKTLMAEHLNSDLKDNMGGFNCGKPAGFIKDYKYLSDEQKKPIKFVKMVRVLFGTIVMEDPVDYNGDPVDLSDKTISFIWEIDNTEARKRLGEPLALLINKKRYPMEYYIELSTENKKLATGASFFLPITNLINEELELTNDDSDLWNNYMKFVDNYNEYIIKEWDKGFKQSSSDKEKEIVESFIDIE